MLKTENSQKFNGKFDKFLERSVDSKVDDTKINKNDKIFNKLDEFIQKKFFEWKIEQDYEQKLTTFSMIIMNGKRV